MRLVTYKVVCKQKTGIPRRCKVATWHRRGPPGHHLRVEARRRVVQVTYRDSGLPARLGRPGSSSPSAAARGIGAVAAARAARPLDALGPRSSGAAGAKERVRFGRVTVRPPCKAKGAHIKLGRSSRMWLQHSRAGQTRLGHAPSIHFFLGRYNECLLSSNIYNQYILLRATFKLPYCKTTQRPINSFS